MRSEDHLALGLYLLSRENSPQFQAALHRISDRLH